MHYKQEYDDLSVRKLLEAMPESRLSPNARKSIGYFIRDYALYTLFTIAVLTLDSWFWSTLAAVALGTVIFGLFILGHDCAHFAFTGRRKFDQVFGVFTLLPSLWPYHVWRISHDQHHRHLHCIEGEVAWVPITVESYKKLTRLGRHIYVAWRTYLFPLAGSAFMLATIGDAIRGRPASLWGGSARPAVLRSILWVVLYVLVLGAFGFVCKGWLGVFLLAVLPPIVSQAWLSVYTLTQHTHESNRFLAADEWTVVKGTIGSTMHIRFPRVFEWLHHDINWHVPHHICARIPHYRLRAAHAALTEAFPEHVRVDTLGTALFRGLMGNCHLITSHEANGLGWVSVFDLKRRERARKSQAALAVGMSIARGS